MQYEGGMTLGEVIERLRREPEDKIIALGWGGSGSYRGYYECVAFLPEIEVPVSRLLAEAEATVGKTFHGWKGGNYTMQLDTECYLAESGDCGVPVTERLLELLLNAERKPL